MKVKLTVIVATLDNDTPQNVAEDIQELLQREVDAVVTGFSKVRDVTSRKKAKNLMDKKREKG